MKYYITFLLLLSGLAVHAQNNAHSVKSSYKSMVNDGKNLYALNTQGQLNAWDLQTLKKVYTQKDTLPQYTAIGKNRDGKIFLGSSKGFVYQLNSNFTRSAPVFKHEDDIAIHFLFFNMKNEMYLIIDEGIYSVVNKKIYSEFTNTGLSAREYVKPYGNDGYTPANVFFSVPETTFMDSSGRLWMSKNMGEFGATRNIFDTNTNKILDEVEDINHIQSFVEDDEGNIYVTQGLNHRLTSYGEIKKILADVTVTTVYNYELDISGNIEHSQYGLFIGPGAWSSSENKLYFSTSTGFYKASVSPENKLDDIKKLFELKKPTYRSKNHTIGYQMAVKQMEFLPDNRLLIRTAANGIGIYNGNEVIMLE